MKIILADDERLVRVGLQSMLEELARKGSVHDLEIRQASDGNELMQVLAEFRPHAAFIDIKMPGRSGLQVLEEVSAACPNVCWIVLTGYAEFEHARKSIDLGVLRFLVKPASIEDLEDVLSKVASVCSEQADIRAAALENRIGAIFNGTLSASYDEFLAGRSFAGILLVFDSSLPDNSAALSRKSVARLLRKKVNEWNFTFLPDNITVSMNGTGLGGILISCTAAGAHAIDLQPLQFHFLTQLAEEAEAAGEAEGLSISGFLFERKETTEFYMKTVMETENFSGIRFLAWSGSEAGQNPPVMVTERFVSGERERGAEIRKTGEILNDLLSRLRNPDMLDIHDDLKQLAELCRSSVLPWSVEKLRRFLKSCQVTVPENAASVEELIEAAERDIRGRAVGLGAGTEGYSVRRGEQLARVLDLVRERYCSGIGLAQVADEMGLSPNYLSSEFKRQMKVGFSEYITGLRMEKAKELLLEPGMTVKNAAGYLGYVSSRHFSQLFFTCYGMKPSEFIELKRKSENNAP